MHIDYYPASFTLQDLSDFFTIPGHSPPLALHSMYHYRRQTELGTIKTKFAFVAFEEESTKKAVMKLSGLELNGCAIKVMVPKYSQGRVRWQWNAFPFGYQQDYERQHDRRRSSRQLNNAPARGRDQAAKFKDPLVPHKIMLRYPQLHVNQFPPDSPHVTVPKLFDFFAQSVDRSLILSIHIDPMDRNRLVVPAFVALKTQEAADALRTLSLPTCALSKLTGLSVRSASLERCSVPGR